MSFILGNLLWNFECQKTYPPQLAQWLLELHYTNYIQGWPTQRGGTDTSILITAPFIASNYHFLIVIFREFHGEDMSGEGSFHVF